MDSEVIQAFSKSLMSIQEHKGAVSKQKITEATKAALTAIRYYKHVVFVLEKFLLKCRPEHKVPGFYLIDSILRRAKKEYKHKDVYAPRFALNMSNTVANALMCDPDDRLKIVRVLNLWVSNNIFEEAVIEPWLQFCRARGLEVDLEAVEKKVKGDKANMSLYTGDSAADAGGHPHGKAVPRTPPMESKRSGPVPRTPPLELRPATPASQGHNLSSEDVSTDDKLSEREVLEIVSAQDAQWAGTFGNNSEMLGKLHRLINDRVTERAEIENRRQGNIKNLLSRDFEYSDEEDDDEPKQRTEQPPQPLTREALLSLTQTVLADPSVRKEVQNICTGNSGGSANGHVQGVPPPMPADFSVPPPGFLPGMPAFSASLAPPTLGGAIQQQFKQANGSNADPRDRSARDRRDRRRERSRSRERADPRYKREDPRRQSPSRERERDRDRSNKDRDRSHPRAGDAAESSSKRNRSPSPRRRERGRDREADDKDKSRDPEKDKEREKLEKERRKLGLPTKPKDGHLLLASRTLWFGRLPANCSENEIKEAVKEAGEPEHISIIPSRACAYVTMPDRRSAFKIVDKLSKDLQVMKKNVKLDWALGQGIRNDETLMEYSDLSRGISQIPYSKLPDTLDALLIGSWLDTFTLPPHLKGQYTEKARNLMMPQQPMFPQIPMFLPQHVFPAQPPVSQPGIGNGSGEQPSIPTPQMLPPSAIPLIPGFPPGIPLPPGVQLPPGAMQLPPGAMQLPPQLLMQQQQQLLAAAAAAGMAGCVPMPPGVQPHGGDSTLSGAPMQAAVNPSIPGGFQHQHPPPQQFPVQSQQHSFGPPGQQAGGFGGPNRSFDGGYNSFRGRGRGHGNFGQDSPAWRGGRGRGFGFQGDRGGGPPRRFSRDSEPGDGPSFGNGGGFGPPGVPNAPHDESQPGSADGGNDGFSNSGFGNGGFGGGGGGFGRPDSGGSFDHAGFGRGGRGRPPLFGGPHPGFGDRGGGFRGGRGGGGFRGSYRGGDAWRGGYQRPPQPNSFPAGPPPASDGFSNSGFGQPIADRSFAPRDQPRPPFGDGGPPKKQSRFEPLDESAREQPLEAEQAAKFGEPPSGDPWNSSSQMSSNLRAIPLTNDSEPSSTHEPSSSDQREAVSSTTTTDETPRFEADSLGQQSEASTNHKHFAQESADANAEPTSTSNDDAIVAAPGAALEEAAVE